MLRQRPPSGLTSSGHHRVSGSRVTVGSHVFGATVGSHCHLYVNELTCTGVSWKLAAVLRLSPGSGELQDEALVLSELYLITPPLEVTFFNSVQ